MVRTDHGTECQGELHQYLDRLGIHHSLISVAHPCTNSLVERYNGVICRGLQKQLAVTPGIHLKEVLPEVLVGQRILPTRVGLSPFLLLFKQKPRWPLGEATMLGGDMGDLADDLLEDVWWQ